MNQNQTQEERQFLIEQAKRLQNNGEPCKLVTNTQHSILAGKIVNISDGGLVFESPVERVFITWSNVSELVEPIATTQGRSSAASAGTGGGYQPYQSGR